jgi:hypothetical protein
MQQQVLDYHKPLPGEAIARVGGPVLQVACAVLRTGSRAGAIGQLCIAFSVFVMLSREPMNVGIHFWRKEAMIAAGFSLLWVACPWNERRRQAVAFLVVNALGWGFSLLLPTLNY